MKTVILSKSCSRCGGSTVLEGQTLRKSIRRATPNGTGKKNQQKSFPAPSPDALFRSRARFWSILGFRPDPKNHQNRPRKKSVRLFGAAGNRFFAFSSLGRVPEGSRTDSGGSGGALGRDSGRIFRYFLTRSAVILVGFVGFRRNVAGIHTPPASGTHSAGFLWGTAISRSELNNEHRRILISM